MAAYAKNLNTAEIAYSAINEVLSSISAYDVLSSQETMHKQILGWKSTFSQRNQSYR